MDSSGSELGRFALFDEHDNKLSGSVKDREYLDALTLESHGSEYVDGGPLGLDVV